MSQLGRADGSHLPQRSRRLLLGAAVITLVADPLRKMIPQASQAGLLLVYLAAGMVVLAALLAPRMALRLSSAMRVVVGTTAALAALATGTWLVTPGYDVAELLSGASAYFLFLPVAPASAKLLSISSPSQRASAERLLGFASLGIALSGLASVVVDMRVFSALTDEAGIRSFGSDYLSLNTGLFATGERLARSLLPGLFVGVIVLGSRTPSARIYRFALPLSFLALYFTNRRFALVLGVLGCATLLLLGRNAQTRVARLALIVIAGGAVSLLLGVGSDTLTFYQNATDQTALRASIAFEMPEIAFVGEGPGSNSQGSRALGGDAPGAFEGQIGRVAYELGSFGLALWIFWAVAVAWVAMQSATESRNALSKAAGIIVGALLIWSVKAHTVFGDPFSVMQVWVAIGLASASSVGQLDQADTPAFGTGSLSA